MTKPARGNAKAHAPRGPRRDSPKTLARRHAAKELPNVSRDDAWLNERTGIGTEADKTAHGFYAPVRRIMDPELTDLYNGSALAAKLVELRPREMFRRGYEVVCKEVDTSVLSDLRNHALDRFELDSAFKKAMTFGRLYGGGLTILGVDDGNMPDEPLDESRIRSFRFLNYVDRRFAYVLDYYNDPLNLGQYGKPRHYLVSNAVAGFQYGPSGSIGKVAPEVLRRRGFGTTVVHESRVIRWEGIGTDYVTMQTLAGWTWSVLQRIYDAMRRFEHAFDAATHLLADANQGVFTMKDLVQSISAGRLPALRQRLRLMDELRSVMHSIVLDKEETFERKSTTFGGIAELLDKMMLRFSGDVDTPATRLFGMAPAGLNATGESDTQNWYETIGGEQKEDLEPRLTRFYRLLSLSADCPVKLPKSALGQRWEIKFKPLRAPSDKEQADTDLAIANRDKIMIDSEVVTPEEVALDKAGWYPSMDIEAREKAIASPDFDPTGANEPAPGQILPNGEPASPNIGIPVAGTTSLNPQTTPSTPAAKAAAAAALKTAKAKPPPAKPKPKR